MIHALWSRARRLRMKTLKPFGRGRDAGVVRLSLCDANEDVAAALAESFRDLDAVEVVVGDVLSLDADALVSPANSFGDMGGGVDKRIDDFYRGEAQRKLAGRIAGRWHGEIPVGSADVLAMSTRRFPFLIVAPTMRIPGRVDGTINAYLAFRAALIAVIEHNRRGEVAIAGLASTGVGTGVGAMTGDEAGRQMRAAYDMVVLEGWRRLAHPIQVPFAASREYRPATGEC